MATAGFISASNPAIPNSPFEAAVIALSPTAHYRFRDGDFSSQIADSSGNGYHLTKQIATAARGVRLRWTHPGGLYVPVISQADWATQGILYSLAATSGLDVPLGGAATACWMIGIKLISTPPWTTDQRVFSVGTVDTDLSGTNSITAMFMDTAADDVQFQNRGAGGELPMQDASPTSSTQIYSLWVDWNASPEAVLDSTILSGSTEKDSGTLGVSSYQDLDRATFLGGRTSATTPAVNMQSYIVDHVSFWVPTLTQAQLDTLRDLYKAEII